MSGHLFKLPILGVKVKLWHLGALAAFLLWRSTKKAPPSQAIVASNVTAD